MTDNREELLAQRAEIDAKLAALDAQPDWICSGIPDEAVEAGIAAWDKAKHDLENYTSGETADWDEGMIVCAIYKAMAPLAPAPPPMGEAAQTRAELVEALRETVGLIGAPSDFRGLRDTYTVDHTITVSIGQVKRWAALLRKIEGDPA